MPNNNIPMFVHATKWLKKAAIAAIVALQTITATLPALAVESPTLEITDVEATTINQGVVIEYCLSTDAEVNFGIFQPSGASSTRVATLVDQEVQIADCYTYIWDQTHDSTSETESNGTQATDGRYFYFLEATNDHNVDQTVTKSAFITASTSQLEIVGFDVKNRSFDPYAGQEVEFEFTLNKSAEVRLQIFDEFDNELEYEDTQNFSAGDNSIYWDGRNQYNEIVNQDEYDFKLVAVNDDERDVKEGQVQVDKGAEEEDDDTVDPRLKRVYVTKEEFDPGNKEKTYIVYTLQAEADVKVVILDNRKQEVEELLDKRQDPGTYVVAWDGEEAIGEEGTYTYKIIAHNSAAEDIEDGRIRIEEDDENTNNKPNIYKDQISELPFDPQDEYMDISFRIDRDAEVTVEIKDGNRNVRTLIEDVEFDEGVHTISWNGYDKYGELIDDGIYQYEITARNRKGKDEEEGNFSVEDSGSSHSGSAQCGGFSDVPEFHPYCEAIDWAADEGIFVGFNDQTFRPDQSITRAQALKTILEALNVKTISNGGSNLGFIDVDRFSWYMPYINTGLSLGVISGYPNGTFAPNQSISRIESLVMLLNTARIKGLIIPSNNYGQPYFDTPNQPSTQWYLSYAWMARTYELTDNNSYLYPGHQMTRGEMADMLYRYYRSGLDS